MLSNKSGHFALKGNLIYCNEDHSIEYKLHSYVICQGKHCIGTYEILPQEYQDLTVYDYGDALIVPGMTDLHLHAPQYPFRGIGMDCELLDWLTTHTFPEEEKYKDIAYAKAAYSTFVSHLLTSTTTRACLFATIHNEATLLLMELLEKSGLISYVGRVNMDRNGGAGLCEQDATTSYEDTLSFLKSVEQAAFHRTYPIITPRFIPCCSDELMTLLSSIQKQFSLPIQSHLSETPDEIAWVKSLVPSCNCYGGAYASFDLFGNEIPTIMAHCVHSTPEEIALLKSRGVFVAHCPESNINLASGIAPIRQYIEEELFIGLGSDVSGGTSLSLFHAMRYAIQSSKLYYRVIDQTKKPLTTQEVFYLATLGGGQFFGKVGSFLPGFEFDAVILDDTSIVSTKSASLPQRLERLLYLSQDATLLAKYVAGMNVLERGSHTHE